MRSMFGWDYPPGVSSLPWDEDYPCDVCGQYENNCICPSDIFSTSHAGW